LPLRKSLVSVKGSAMKNGGAVVPENVASHEVFFFWDSFLVGAGVNLFTCAEKARVRAGS